MLKKLPLFFTLFFNFVLFSQNTVQIDSLFTKKIIKPYLEYYHDISKQETINTIQEKKFSAYADKNFPGLFAAKFWFKLNISNNTKDDINLFYKVKAYAFYKKFKVYKVTKDTTKVIYASSDLLIRKFDVPTNLEKNEHAEYYLEVYFLKSVFLPIKLVTDQKNNSEVLKETLLQGLYYGFAFLVLIVNLFFFYYTKNKFFLYYVIIQFAIVGSIAFLDGIIYQIFGNSLITRFINIIFNLMLAGGSILFLINAINLEKNFPLFKYITGGIFMLCIFFFSIYMYTWSFHWSGLGKICYLSILLICFFTAIYFIKKKVYARFFFFAYGVLFTCHILFILPVLYGFKDLGFTEWHYKIGSAIEMIIFLLAIPYRHKSLSKEKENIEQELDSHKEQLLEKNKKTDVSNQQKTENFKSKFNLSVREVEVLNYILEGKKNKEIADNLFISEATVKYHCSKLYEKTIVKNRSQLTALFNGSV